jgi:DNA-binding transcriptional LysR family regulator
VQLIDSFMAEHPQVRVDLTLTDGYVDLVAQGIDLALRFGTLKDSTLQQRKLGSNRRLVCAAPSYLKRHCIPRKPADLADHDCIRIRFGDTVDHAWAFSIKGKPVTQIVRGSRISNDGELVRAWCLRGYGIALKSDWDVAEHIAKGELVVLLAKYAPARTSLSLVYPGGRTPPRRIIALMDHVAQNVRKPSCG